MFNQSGFNEAPFNAPESIDVLASAVLSGEGSIQAAATVDVTASAHLSGAGTIVADFVREIEMQAHLSGQGTISATFVRDRHVSVTLSGRGTLRANANKYEVKYITFTGKFNPGDQIVIDMEKFKVTRNGASILNLIAGDFFNLKPGDNELVFEDSESSRQIRMRISHTDRYL